MGFDNGTWMPGTPTEKLSVKPDTEFQEYIPGNKEKEGFSKSNETFDTFDTSITGAASSRHPIGTNAEESPTKKSKPDNLTDSKLARNMADQLKVVLCFDEISSDWCVYIGGIWGEVSKTRAQRIIDQQLHRYLPDGFSMAKLNGIEAFLKIYLSAGSWKVKKTLLQLKNGVLDTQKMELVDFSPEYRFRWQLPYHYRPEVKIRVTEDFLKNATQGDIELINIIRAFFKITLIGGDLQRFLELIGPGGTGKSTLERLLIMLVGDVNCIATDLKNLEQNRFETASLYGKRLAIISDSSRYGGEVAALKAITGGDPIRLERKNQQQAGSFVFEGTVIIVSNEAIQSSDYSSGLARRRLPVTFERKITDEDKQKWRSVGGIEQAMKAELPGLLNWVLSMSDKELMAAIGSINGEMTKAQLKHYCKTNKLAAWIDDNLIISEGSVIYIGASTSSLKDEFDIKAEQRSKLYPNYLMWCIQHGVQAVAVQRFSENLIDVCGHLKLPVELMPRSSSGRRIKGLIIRETKHNKIPTPITNTYLDDECRSSAEVMPKQSLDNAGSAEDVDKNLSVINLEDI